MNIHAPDNIRVAKLQPALDYACAGNFTNAALAISTVKDDPLWSVEDREQLHEAYNDALRGDAMSCVDYLTLVMADDSPVGCLE